MSLKDYAIMPYSDYVGACDAIREKDGSSAPIKSGELRSKILGIETGAEVSVVTATAPDVLNGKIFVDENGNPVTGSMPNNGSGGGTISTKAGTIAIPEGYYDGTGSVSISSTEQAKIKSANIVKGVSVLGVAGAANTYKLISGSFTAENVTSVTVSNSSFKSGQTVLALILTGGKRAASTTTRTLLNYAKVGSISTGWSDAYSGGTSNSGSITSTIAAGSATFSGTNMNGTYNYAVYVQ